MHQTIQPQILYFGTPVVIISTINPDGTPNIAPILSIWWMNQSCMIGMSSRSQTIANLKREQQCTINLASADLVHAVDRLALTTGLSPVPEYKQGMGYVYVPDKFEHAGLTPVASQTVQPPCIQECPVQMEALLEQSYVFDAKSGGHLCAAELKINRIHIEEALLNDRQRIVAERWHPLIMNFCEFFTTGTTIYPSRLAEPFTKQYYSS